MKSLVFGWIILATLSPGAQSAKPSGLGVIKQWQLHTQHGDIGVKLSKSPIGTPGRAVLSLEPGDDSIPTASEEMGLIAQVLHEMLPLGYEPRNLEMISTWLQNSEYLQGVQHSVAESGKWKSCAGRKYCHEAEGVADQYLKSIDAFKPFDEVLHKYGLRRKTVRMDDMGVWQESGHILCSGLIVIVLEREQ